MESHTQELVTKPLSNAQLRDLSKEIPDLFGSWGESSVRVMYGWACNLPIDELWKVHAVPSLSLYNFIHESERDGLLVMGESDLFIGDNQETTYFLLCHEADVHFVSSDQHRLACVIQSWKPKGLGLRLAEYDEVQRPNREWVEI